jgi:hypothetical protein
LRSPKLAESYSKYAFGASTLHAAATAGSSCTPETVTGTTFTTASVGAMATVPIVEATAEGAGAAVFTTTTAVLEATPVTGDGSDEGLSAPQATRTTATPTAAKDATDA